MLTLVRRSFDRVLTVWLALAGVLAVFQVVLVIVAASLETSGSFERLAPFVPAFINRAMSGSLLTLASFRAMSIAGYFHPIVVLIMAQLAIYVASEPAGDVELGLVDLVLARPLPRRRLITRSILVAAGATAATTAVMGIATYAGLLGFAPVGAPWPAPRTIAVLSVELLIVAWTLGAAALAVASFARRRSTAITAVGVAAVALYLLEFLGASWAPAAPFARVSPFHYYDGTAVLVGRADVLTDVAVLAAMTAAGVAVAYWQFSRRDL